ncbi:hypothetical protein [Mesorhizobium sp. SP-1A]|uniref:hypothetical protein n=1 Tax=Mesorhizobium sp. SP-1A TaxID=3077840 RepID=UPI0028F6FC35|nr:hypothetical protein [Mesorhizobium sp. SP-1A]
MSLDKDLDAMRDWDAVRPARTFRAADAGMGLLRVTLLFGSAAIALALIVTPLLEGRMRQPGGIAYAPGLDMTATGSIGRSTYTLRRSVLQPSADSVCIISDDGRRSGDC